MIQFASPVDDNAQVRARLYAGEIFRWAPTAESLAFVVRAWSLVTAEFGPDPRRAQFALSNDEIFQRMGRLRKALFSAPQDHARVCRVLASCGFDPAEQAFDPARLRAVLDHGHELPAAAAVYYPHRDTWYAHPSCMLTWWLALHDATSAETFAFFPDWFARSVPNDSEAFDDDRWNQQGDSLRIGWQDPAAGRTARYPGLLGEFDRTAGESFDCRAGELIVFSGAHLHATLPHAAGQTRFSLDFRTVHLGDLGAGRGAPNVDGRSTGSAVKRYIHPGGSGILACSPTRGAL